MEVLFSEQGVSFSCTSKNRTGKWDKAKTNKQNQNKNRQLYLKVICGVTKTSYFKCNKKPEALEMENILTVYLQEQS